MNQYLVIEEQLQLLATSALTQNASADVCQQGDARLDPSLSDGTSGVVEVCLDGVWTSVCGDGWSPVQGSKQ